MKTKIFNAALLFFSIMLVSCAATYKPIVPATINFNSHDLQDGISMSYKYDVLKERGNNKYAKKEDKKNIKVIAVKITNNTDTVINVGKDLVFYSGVNQLFPMEPTTIKSTIKQSVPSYLPYLLLTFMNLYVTKVENGFPKTDTYRIGLILGPGITIGNMAVASTANDNMLNELNECNILNKDIQKNETIYGIIGLKDNGYTPISVKLKK